VAGGAVEPSLVEVGADVPLRHVLARCGIADATGALTGGLFGGLAGPETLDRPLCDTALGGGAIHALTPADRPGDVAADALGFLAAQSARQCGVCVSGTRALADAVAALAEGAAAEGTTGKIERWSAGLPGRGACGLLDAAARIAGSLLPFLLDFPT